MQYWLMKSEPSVFSIDDLAALPKQTDHWDGIRNYQARNFMRDQMQVGDKVLFYHSNADPNAVVGTAVIASKPYPDHTAWDPKSKYFDKRSTQEAPVWMMVDVRFESRFDVPVSLGELREVPGLEDMLLLKKGQRLSIQPVTEAEYGIVLKQAEIKAGKG